jgi:hypothetical protein
VPRSAPALDAGDDGVIFSFLSKTNGKQEINRSLFRLARHVHGRPGGVKACRPWVQRWCELVKPVIGEMRFIDAWAEFVAVFRKVRLSAAEDALNVSWERASQATLPDWALDAYGGDVTIVRLILLCRELQRHADEIGEPEFYLACRSAGRKLNVCHMTAWKYMRILVADEVLEITTPGEPGRVGGRATRYRYLKTD